MAKQKLDPNHPLFKRIIQNRFKAWLFGVPSVIGLILIIVPLDLEFWTEVELIVCCTCFGNGVAFYYFAGDLEKQLRKIQSLSPPKS